ncbi:MAG: hexokinase [Treponemataceae bacterium]|nr:hexokinase [Treponemataceae bacterium]
MSAVVKAFFKNHGFVMEDYEPDKIADALMKDMDKGLRTEKSPDNPDSSNQDMIPTWMSLPEGYIKNSSVIVIDAGGTNFRSSLVTFDSEGKPSVSDFEKTCMPGIERELTKKEFFDQIAENLEHLKNKASRIAFCFSYAMKITSEGDGQVLNFAKEIKASEVIGSYVGKELSATLVEHGWNKPEKIVLLNDTVAALLAATPELATGKEYGTFVGFILGTGMNSAYLEQNVNIKKLELEKTLIKDVFPGNQIVVCESGKFNGLPVSDFDKALDEASTGPGTYRMEKQCSGAYLGPLCMYALKAAAKDGLFDSDSALKEKLLNLSKLELIQVAKFLDNPLASDNIFSDVKDVALKEILFEICDAFVERSARLSSGILLASILKADTSKMKDNRMNCACISCDGTTLLKTYHLKSRIEALLYQHLTLKHGISFETVAIENPITIGTAMAAFGI